MNRKHLVRHAAILALTAAAILPLSAQTTSQIVANPSGVTINLAAPIGQQVALSLAGGATGVITVTPAQGLLVNNSRNSVAVQAPGTITINVDPNNRPTGLSQLYVDANVFGSTLPGYRIPVSFGTGGGGGNPIGNFFATPNSLSFSAPTGTQTASQSFNVSSTTGAIPTYYISTSNAAWLQTSPSPGVQTTSSVVTVLANPVGLAPGTYSGSISLIPTASGFTTITVPVNLTVGQAGSGSFYATPTAVNFTYATGSTSPITQSFTLSSTMGQVPYTAVLSTNLVNYGLQLTPTSGTAPQTVSITLPSPQLVPAGTSGFITITPAAGSGASAFTIPVNINGTGTGTGSLTISPSTLTFSSPIGGGVPPVQVISVNSATGTPQSFTVSASSSQNFITAQASSNVTPATVTVGVSPFAATTPGTYIGTVNITPTTGPSAGVAVPIQVTYTIGTVSGGQVTPDESAVTLETQAGATTRVTRAVALRATGTAVSYTTAVTTTGGGNWLSVDPATGTAPSTIVIAADPSNLAPGTYTGAIAFTPAGQSAFSIGVTLNVASSGELRAAPASLSFAHQTTTTTGPASQTVQLTSTGTALTWTATPTTTAGGNWLQVTPATGATGTAATISVNITGLAAGSYTGNVRFTSPGATNREVNVPVTLTVTTPTVPRINSFLNAGSLTASVAVPGLIVTLTGTDLGPATAVSGAATNGQYPTTLGNVRVLFDGTAAPVFYASASQINAVVPFEVAGRVSTRVVVERDGTRSSELEMRVADTAPALLTSNMTGTGQAAALNQNGTPNSPTNPEARGNVIVLYGTGMGVLTPAVASGGVTGSTVPFPAPSVPVRVRIGGQEARVLYAGAAPGLIAGLFQINAVIPEAAATGTTAVAVQVGDVTSQSNTTISVR